MLVTYTRSVATDTLNGSVSGKLTDEIQISAIVTALDNITINGDVLEVIFKAALSPSDELILDNVLAAHDGISLITPPVTPTVNNVIVSEIPTLDPNASRIEFSDTDISLPKNSQPFIELYSYNGTGKLHSFNLLFDSEKVEVKLTVDANVIFELDCKLLSKFNEDDDEGFARPSWVFAGDESFTFDPNHPMKFSSSVLIEARANSSSSSREMIKRLIKIEKES